jgi:hypothetical protein
MRLFESCGAVTSRRVGAVVVVVLAAGSGCGSPCSTGVSGNAAPATGIPTPARPAIARAGHSATIRFRAGRRTAALTMPEPGGVILLYRISAPVGARIRATTQLPSTTVPLLIQTARVGPSGSCHVEASRVTCTVGEEWCPMPAGTWHVHLRKLGGPAGPVTIWFDVGQPPDNQAE